MNPTIVLGTRNPHKVKEIVAILKDLSVRFESLLDYPEIEEIEETGSTFVENALIKARTVFRSTHQLTLADDSGLEVDALNGAPGLYSARYAGKEKDYNANNQKLLEEMKEVPPGNRGAQFRCVVAIVGPGIEKVVEGVLRGRIARFPRGSAGFGFDPLFIPEGYEQTLAELGETVKNQISHRARAFRKAKEIIRQEVLSGKNESNGFEC